MSYVTWKLERYAFQPTTNTWSALAQTITDEYDMLVEQSIGDGKDKFSFKLVNQNSRYDNYFQPQDKIVISRASNTSTVTPSNIMMVGALKDIPFESSGSSNILRLEGYNFSETIMSSITFFEAVSNSPSTAIQTALGNAGAYNTNFQVTWDATNPTTKSTGGAFPTFSKKYYNVPLNKVIEELSTDQFTGDGTYIWWVDLNNKLQWRNRNYGTNRTFNSTTDTYKSIKAGKDINGVRNFIILKGGRDPAGKPIQVRYQDFSSSSKHGVKYFFAVSLTTSAENLNKQDIPDQSAASRFPTSYPFTTVWRKQSTNSTVTVSSNSEYVTAIRNEIKDRLQTEGASIAETYKYGKLKIDLRFAAGAKDWVLSDRVACTVPKLFSGTKTLRVAEVQYGTVNDVYSLEEDVGTL